MLVWCKGFGLQVLCWWPVLPDGEQDLVPCRLHGEEHLRIPPHQPTQVSLNPSSDSTQRYLTLIDCGLVYIQLLSSPWGRFSDYSATGT
jgi:hypothetical protein